MKPYRLHGLRVSMVRESGLNLSERPLFTGPETSIKFLQEYFAAIEPDRERFVILLLTQRRRLIGVNTVSVGTVCQSLVHPREVFKPAIVAGASAVILAHNHPSGDPEPSPEDVNCTRRLIQAGALLGIEILDHVVVGDHAISFKMRGEME